jgi:predicted AAA+ superfamily ATPase
MHPFMAAEVPRFQLQDALRIGMVPIVVAAERPQEVLQAYATLYLEQEVKTEGLTRNVGNFARFLEAISFSHASVLNVSNVARECQIERRTAVAYVDILDDLLLSFRVPPFTKRAQRKTVAHPKFYFFDAGVFRSLRPHGPLDRPEAIDGAALEGLVAAHLRAWIAYSGADVQLFYWRTRAGSEVDFVVYGSDGFWAVEVKNAARVRPEDLRALRGFAAEYPECEPVFLYRGTDRLLVDGIRCLPVEEFLAQLHPSLERTALLHGQG